MRAEVEVGRAGAGGTKAEDERRNRAGAMVTGIDGLVRGLRDGAGREGIEDEAGRVAEVAAAALRDGELVFDVAPFGLLFEDGPLSQARSGEAHWGRLFRDGVRELTFLPGLDADELAAFAALLAEDEHGGSEDLVTRLFDLAPRSVRWFDVDPIPEGGGATAALPEAEAFPPDDLRALAGEDGAGLEWIALAEAPARADEETLRAVRAAREALLEPPDPAAFVELSVVSLGADLAHEAIHREVAAAALRGDVEGVAGILEAVDREADGRQAVRDPVSAALLRDALRTPERLRALAPVYEKDPARFRALLLDGADRYKDGLLGLLGALHGGSARMAFLSLLDEAKLDLGRYYATQIASPVEALVADAARGLGALRTPEALQLLAGALGHSSEAVRLAVLDALGGRYHEVLRVALGRALQDESAEVRLRTLAILEGAADPRVAWLVLLAVKSEAFDARDDREQERFLAVLGRFSDPRCLAWYDEVLAEKNLRRQTHVARQQLHAVRALVAMGSPEAAAILERHRGRWTHPKSVKEAIARALGGEAPEPGAGAGDPDGVEDDGDLDDLDGEDDDLDDLDGDDLEGDEDEDVEEDDHAEAAAGRRRRR